MALRKYTVAWAVEVEAMTPRDAAAILQRCTQCDGRECRWGFDACTQRAFPQVFTVTGEDGHTSRIDLGTDEKFSAQATEALR